MTAQYRTRTVAVLLAVVAAVAALALAGCGGSRSGSDQPGTLGPASAAPGPAGDAQRATLNSTSEDDLAGTLRANDVDDPQKWAQILLEYRPYAEGPAGTAAIRDVLVRFQADTETTDRILNAVVP